ncbi:MAG: ATP-binding protein [Thermotogae bacterium]|nr:MAG: ATP-binding protein [Thermotogota bacterium]
MGLRTIADHILDVAQNGVEAEAENLKVEVSEDTENGRLVFSVEDDGKGMDEETLQRALDPFYSSKTVRRKRVGLGLPFLRQAAEATGGRFQIESEPRKGTRVRAEFFVRHIDCQPLGDLVGSFVVLLATPGVRVMIRRLKGDEGYEIDNGKLDALLGKEWRSDPVKLKLLYNMINELESALPTSKPSP